LLNNGRASINFDNEEYNANSLGRKRLLENLPSKPKVVMLNQLKFKRQTTDKSKAQFLRNALGLEEPAEQESEPKVQEAETVEKDAEAVEKSE
jgi:hypothetical protein